MEIEQPPVDRERVIPTAERRGLLLVHTGDGKGKSTAAFGLALRAHGRGKPVLHLPVHEGAQRPLRRAPRLRAAGRAHRSAWATASRGRARTWNTRRQLAREGWDARQRRPSATGDHFLVVLDEIMYPLRYGWLPLDAVLQALRERPAHVHVVLTGRGAPAELVELADTVTEMALVKHHYRAGIPAQRGIED